MDDVPDTSKNIPGGILPWPDPTPEMLLDPTFNAIWNVIKSWDINVPDVYSGYGGATGNHARAIYDALTQSNTKTPPTEPTVEVPHTSIFADIQQHLGDVIPCYGKQTGCHMDDKTDCSEGCVLLQIYEKAYRCGNSADRI